MAQTSQPFRQNWASRMGVILAVAGSAVGLGNFLRFPVQATQNGGGAFMIPYFIAFLLLGIPMCWVEWAMGRYGGRFSHGSAPGVFDVIGGRRPLFKYIGALGLLGPLLIGFYYVWIESWTLGYACNAALGHLAPLRDMESLKGFLGEYTTSRMGYVFFLITFAMNFFVLFFGISGGIERLNKYAMPTLAIIGLILTARVLTLGTPNAAHPDFSVSRGMGFIWNPDFSKLRDAKVWLAAAGQIFFTLSVGMGVIITYASYLRSDEDIALSGLTASATNEFMEVIIGGSIVIPAAVVFFGVTQAREVAGSGSFSLGFVTMPLIFTKMMGGPFFCFLWFMLLFLAGITSSISILQPFVSFLEDEFHCSRRVAVSLTAVVTFVFAQAAIFGNGVLDEMDFWAGSFLIVLFGLIEIIMFAWIFGMGRAWDEINRGSEITIWPFFRWIIGFVTPVYMFIILGAFMAQNWRGVFLMGNYRGTAQFHSVLIFRVAMLILFMVICGMIAYSWNRHPKVREPKP